MEHLYWIWGIIGIIILLILCDHFRDNDEEQNMEGFYGGYGYGIYGYPYYPPPYPYNNPYLNPWYSYFYPSYWF